MRLRGSVRWKRCCRERGCRVRAGRARAGRPRCGCRRRPAGLERRAGVLGVGDDRGAAGRADEARRGPHLRAHAALGELPGGGVRVGLVRRSSRRRRGRSGCRSRASPWGTPVTSISTSAPSELASRSAARSLSTTASTPCRTCPSSTTGIPPPPAAITTQPRWTRPRMSSSSTIAPRLRRGDEPAVAAAGVLADGPAALLRVPARGRLVEERADGLGRPGERRIVGVDDHVRDDGDHAGQPPTARLVQREGRAGSPAGPRSSRRGRTAAAREPGARPPPAGWRGCRPGGRCRARRPRSSRRPASGRRRRPSRARWPTARRRCRTRRCG